MARSNQVFITRRVALKAGLAALAASGGFVAATRAAFAEDTLAEIKKRGELVAATEMQFPPFDISDNGVYKGLDRDLIDAVGKELGVKVTYLDLPWTSARWTLTSSRRPRSMGRVPRAFTERSSCRRSRRFSSRSVSSSSSSPSRPLISSSR